MSDSTTPLTARYLLTCATMLADATRQRRTALRVVLLTVGLVLVPGRTMLSRVLQVMGVATRDWSAAYRVFARPRLNIDHLRRLLIARWVALYPAGDPVVVVVDGTQLPRTGRKIPGVGFARAPRTPAWRPGIHNAQRWEGVSGLTPPTPAGDCRTIPLWFVPAPSPTARPWAQHPPLSEWESAMAGVHLVRSALDDLEEPDRPLVVVGDGAYSGVGVWQALPANTVLIARCAKNRVLRHLPPTDAPPRRGRKLLYGARGLSPQHQRSANHHSHRCTIEVRGKRRHLRVWVSGPWLLQKGPTTPLFLLTIGGIGRQRRTRDAMHFLVSARRTDGGWSLPYALELLVMWVWQRWEVEVMHRELKSGWGLGDQQQWSPIAASTVIQWVVWAYAVLMLVAANDPPVPRAGPGWYRPRRPTPRDLTFTIRQELWTMEIPEFRPVCRYFGTSPPQCSALSSLLAVVDAI